MNPALPQTVQDWRALGYRGLRIQRCSPCGRRTDWTWEELGAFPGEDVIEAARRVSCRECQRMPAGLAVIAYSAETRSTG